MIRLLCKGLFVVAALAYSLCGIAQTTTLQEDPAYTRTITQRSQKIVVTLGIPDSVAALCVQDIIANQYRRLNAIYNQRDAQVKAVKADTSLNKAVASQRIKTAGDTATARTGRLHTGYLAQLALHLNPGQIDKVKEGMTYGVLTITYRAYQDELPTLTEPQKAQLLAWLTEAREYAMDAESSEKKHAWFGKYKGRINNYLSANGYDMKKAGEEWEKRRKAANDS